MSLPIITNQSDTNSTTADDAVNRPATSVYQCQEMLVDVSGPGFLTGNVTWSVRDSLDAPVTGAVISGQSTVSATLMLDTGDAPGNYTIKACETAAPTNCSTWPFTLVALPPVTASVPNQSYVGGTTQFVTTYPYTATWGLAGVANAQINATTGLATWATSGTKSVTYSTDTGCDITLSYVVYEDITVAEFNADCIEFNSQQSIALTVTGGSGDYTFSVTGQNTVSSVGVVTAGIYSGTYTVSVIDNTAGIIKNIPICIGAQNQFCVNAEVAAVVEANADNCCEISVDCGESLTLTVPTFHVRVDGHKEAIIYSSFSGGTTSDNGYLKSGTEAADAVGNVIDCSNGEALFEIVTNMDMADTANGPMGIGWSSTSDGTGISTIERAVVWFTSASVRYVELRNNGVAESGSQITVIAGDAISAGYFNGEFVIYKNNVLQFTSLDPLDCCGTKTLKVAIETAGKVVGGNLSGLTWTIVTAGLPTEVGIIDANGVYVAPTGGYFGLVQAQASLGNAKFRLSIRNIKPTPRYTDPRAFLTGNPVEIWVGPYIPGFNETIRIAKDGSPDALQNPGMIDLGILEGSAKFTEQMTYQDFDNDIGTYATTLSKEAAEMTATFLEVRDLAKLSLLKPNAILHPTKNGTREFSVGGRFCATKELRVLMIIKTGDCDTASYDVLYLPRVQNKGNLGLEIGRKTNGKFELTLSALPDFSRPQGSQLFSLLQIGNC